MMSDILSQALKPQIAKKVLSNPLALQGSAAKTQDYQNVMQSNAYRGGATIKSAIPSYQSYKDTRQSRGDFTSPDTPINLGFSGYVPPTPGGNITINSPAGPITPYTPEGTYDSTTALEAYNFNNPNRDYTMSDSELLEQQLRNALLLKELGYKADFTDGTLTFEEQNQFRPSPYGQYGTQESQYVYESDYLRVGQGQQQVPTRYTYQPSQQRYGQYGYDQGRQYEPQSGYYPQNGYYQQRYYSNYGQRYNSNGYNYNGYNQRYRRNNYNGYRRQYNYKRSDGYANRYNSRVSSGRTRGWY